MALPLPERLIETTSVDGLPGMRLEPANFDRLIYVTRDGRDLCVHPRQRVAFLRSHADGRFPFLIVSEAGLADLRQILSHRWRRADGERATPAPLAPFGLEFGEAGLDLSRAMPMREPNGSDFKLVGEAGPIVLEAPEARPPEVLLRRGTGLWRAPEVATIEALHRTPQARLTVAAEEEHLALPITVCAEDHSWLHDKPYGGGHQITGRIRCHPAVTRERDKFVMLARHTEGNVFDTHEFSTEFGYTTHLGAGRQRHLPMLPGMRCEGERLFVEQAVLDRAPRLSGPHIVFTTPTLANYAHWLIDNILPLTLLVAHAPAEAKILLPATLRGFAGNPIRICNHHDTFRAFGLSGLPFVELADPYVFTEDVFWLDNGFIHNMPGEKLRNLRDRVMRGRPAAPRDRHIYIARRGTRRVRNAAEIGRFLQRRDFTIHALDDYSIDEQIDLFSRAAWVVAPHGAELGNLLFCAPGTKVLELSPELDFKPYFSYMCNKLALTHGILPCPTSDGGFSGEMTVDMEKFGALFRMIKHHY